MIQSSNLPISSLIVSFLDKQLEVNAQPLTDFDKHTIRIKGIEKYLFEKIISSKYRRTALDDETVKNIQKKISQHVAGGMPIEFSIPFGAYKAWQLESYPEPDWAEVFNLHYICEYASQLAAAYPPGIIINYSYTDDIMHIISNTDRERNRQYIPRFNSFLSLFQSKCPSNITLNSIRINDFYDNGDILGELYDNYEFNKTHWEEKYSTEERESKIKSAQRNLCPDGPEDLRQLSESEWEVRCLEAAMLCDALDSLKMRRWFNKYSTNIQIIFVRGRNLSLHFGSCETSTVQFWVGSGAVEIRQNGTLLPRILSYNQASRLKDSLESFNLKNIYDTSELGDGLSRIYVLKSERD
jgi:hypothetical protein